MPDKLEIEKYCNRYEGLSSLVNSLAVGTLSSTDAVELQKCVSYIKQDIKNITAKTSSCGDLSNDEKEMYGIIPSEIGEINSLSEEIGVDSKELMYYLVCAKMPFYMSKVERSLKTSFVDAASSLYYIECYYLFSSISKLFELDLQNTQGTKSESLDVVILRQCIDQLKRDAIPSALIGLLNQCISNLQKLSYRRLKSHSDEITIISRSLFFYFSGNPISKDVLSTLIKLIDECIRLRSQISKSPKDETSRLDTVGFTMAFLDSLCIVALHSLKKNGESTITEGELISLLDTSRNSYRNNNCIVALFMISLHGLQLNPQCKEFRNYLRSAMRYGVFSILFKDLLSFHCHIEDTNFLFIITSVFYQVVYTYLSVQSSYWHTLISKQFAMYEEKETASGADGLETIIYLLQFILSKLPGLQINLSGSDMDDNILPYFCTMVSDRLRAEPYLFNSYINLLTAIANTSQVSADSVYSFIDKAPSEFVSWPIMIGCLNEAEKLIHSDTAQCGLLDHDLTGFICILDLITAVMKNSSSCRSLHTNMRSDTIQMYIKLLHEPVHVLLKSKILAVLTCFAKDNSLAMTILGQLDYGRILTKEKTTGIRYELESIETPAGMYPLTSHFLRLLLQLTSSCSPYTVINSPSFPSILDYVINGVFLQYDIRNTTVFRSGEKYKIASLCVELLSVFMSIFPDVFGDKKNQNNLNNPSNQNNQMVLERLCMVISELLSYTDITSKLVKIATIQPSHTVIGRHSFPTDGFSESSSYIDFELIDAYPVQVDLIQQSMNLLRQLLEITPEMICELGLFSQTSKSSLITSLSSQLLADSSSTINILQNISYSNQPSLQLSSIQVLKLLVDQLDTNLIMTLLDSYPVEASTIRSALNQLLIQTLFTYTQNDLSLSPSSNPQSRSVQVLLDMLVAHGKHPFPSAISSLLLFPQSLSVSHVSHSISTLFNSLLTFLETPSLIAFHPLAASKIIHFVYLLSLHRDRTFLKELCSILIDRQVIFRIVSALPFLLEHANQNYIPQLGGRPQFITAFQPYGDEERLGVYSLVFYVLSILCILFYQQKQYHIGLQLVGDELTSLFVYCEDVRKVFVASDVPPPSTSPLLDTLSLIDQQFAEPDGRPEYMNDCVEGCWIQREEKGVKFVQIDLLQLTRNIETSIRNSSNPTYDRIRYFVQEGTSWAYHWNVFMELEAIKSLAFQAGCSLLHIIIIENRESISLLPSFSSDPLNLYLAIIQALLSIANRTTTFDRSYIESIAHLLQDLFVMMSSTSMVIAPFTQQSLFLLILQAILSPLSQQRNGGSHSIRSGYYILFLTFLQYAKKTESLPHLIQSLNPSLEQLVYLLMNDCDNQIYEDRIAELSLLNYLLTTDLKESIIQYIMSFELSLQNMIAFISHADMSIVNDSPESNQQVKIIQGVLSLFTALASTTPGAIFLLNHSIFLAVDQCPLLQLNVPFGYPVYPSKLTPTERRHIRSILKPLFQLILILVDTVRSFRGVRNEIIQFIQSSINCSFIILEDREPDEIQALEVLALYEGILSMIACDKNSLAEELNGFEKIIGTKLLEIVKSVQNDKKLCTEIQQVVIGEKGEHSGSLNKPSKKAVLMKSVVEYSIIYLHHYGESIPSELLKTLGY